MGRRMSKQQSHSSVKFLVVAGFYLTVMFFVNSCINPLGELIGTSEISVVYGGTEISAGSTFSFGEVTAGTAAPELTFTIENLGKSKLSMPTGIIINGTNATMFSVTTQPGKEIEPGQKTSFSLAFNPAGIAGLKTATASIATNDAVVKTFSFSVQGTFSGVQVFLSTSSANPTNISPIPVNINFSEKVDNFTLDDIVVTNGTASSFQITGISSYSIQITPNEDGIVLVNIPEGVAFATGTTNGNVAAPELSRVYDGTPPTGCSIGINNEAAYTNSLEVSLNLIGYDGSGTGVEEMRLSNTTDFGGSPWESFSLSKTWVLSAGIDGERKVYVWFIDHVGNESVYFTDSIIYDSATPVAPGIPDLAAVDDSGASDTDNITSQSTALTFTDITDRTEAFALVQLYSDLDGFLGSSSADISGNWSIDADLTIDPEKDRIHYISATQTDRAGNESSSSPILTLTIQPPNLESIYLSSLSSADDTPFTPEILAGNTVQLYAYGNQADGSTTDITGIVNWTSLSPAIVDVDAEGLVTGISEGTGNIKASSVDNEGALVTAQISITVIASGEIDIIME